MKGWLFIRVIEYEEINREDKLFPERLKKIKKSPKKIYATGNLKLLEEASISVVGTRHISDYGKRHGRDICKQLAMRDITIVSGLAVGVDTLAHETAMKYSGKTIAVLPCGFDNIFPTENQKLFENIINNGGLAITEYASNIKADSKKFLERNRIVAGLGVGLVVIEALERSGTSVTAKIAKSQGKQVFALPGSVDNKCSVGTNNLIKDGANLITEGVEILKNYPQFEKNKVKNYNNQNIKKEYKNIFSVIFYDKYLSLEEIIKKTGMPTREVITQLTLMELEELIEVEIGKGYRKKYE